MITKNVNGNSISQAFIDEIRSDSPNIVAKLMMDGSEIECDITNLQVFKGSCGSVTLTLGNVIADRLTASVKNLSVDVRKKDIECWIGAWTGGDYEYISMGVFTVSEALKTRYETQITAYSSVVGKTSGLFITERTSLDPPIISELGNEVSEQIGCSISFDSAIDTSQIMMVDLTNATLYQCLQAIAICSGAYLVNDNVGNIYVKRYDSAPTLSVDTSMMVKLPKVDEAPVVVDSVLCNGNYQYSASIAEMVDENGRFITDELDRIFFGYNTVNSADVEFNCDYMTREIFNANIKPIIGYSYWTADVGLTLGDPRLEGVDVLEVTDLDGSVYNVPCHQITHKYRGGLSSSIKSAEPTPKQNDIGSITPIKATQDLAFNSSKELKNMNQYFWFEGEGYDEGAHITQIRKEDFKADPLNGGANLLASTEGLVIRDGLTPLALFSGEELRMGRLGVNEAYVTVTNEGLGVHKGNTDVAFIGESARIGDENDANIIITATETQFHGNAGALVGMIDSGSIIDGPFTEVVIGKRGFVFPSTTTPVLIYSGALAYAPLSDIVIKIPYATRIDSLLYIEAEAEYTRTISSTVDSDVTADGFRIQYTAGARYLQIWYVSGYKTNVELMDLSEYKDINGVNKDWYSFGAGSRSIVLTWPPVSGTRIGVDFGTNEDSDYHAFTAGTRSTYATTLLCSDDDYHTVTTRYDGARTVIVDSNPWGIQIDTLSEYTIQMACIGDISRASPQSANATYDRHFLAPQYLFGVSCESSDYALVAIFGEGLTAGASNQTIVGKYNAINTKAFNVGSGTGSGSRKNAMEVDWNGNTTIAGTLTQGSDRRLKEHIDYLDEDAVEFIRDLKPAHFLKDKEDHVGFYAQDVEESDKWDCMTDEMNGYMTLSYTEIIAPLVRYCQKLEERIEELERREDGECSNS